MRTWNLAVIATVLLIMPIVLRAQAPKGNSIVGIWQGALSVSGLNLRLVTHLSRLPDGTLTGTLDSIDQNAKGIPISKVIVKDQDVRVEVEKIGGVFEGKLNKEGTEIVGKWSQGGGELPLTLKKTDRALELRRPQNPVKPYPYKEEEVTYENRVGGLKLAGTLTLPSGKGPFPVALLISGSGPQDRNESLLGHQPFLVLADYLTRQGIAVLRVDDRGIGGSTGNIATSTTADFADDVLAGVAYLKSRPEIDPKHIGLIGHSEGGVIAPMVATLSKDIAFIVMMAGTGLTGEEILYLQGALIARAAGAPEEATTFNTKLQKEMFAIVKAEKDDKKAEERLREMWKKEKATLPAALQSSAAVLEKTLESQNKAILTPWFRYFLAYDPRPALQKVTCPVLAINGELDLQVPPKENLPAIESALKAGGNNDVTIVLLPKLNHLFQTAKTGAISEYGEIEETIAPVALKTMSDWILKRAK